MVTLDLDQPDIEEYINWKVIEDQKVADHISSSYESRSGTWNSILTSKVKQAIEKGYTGDMCLECQSLTMVKNGTCLKCLTCGSTSGCS
jgi:ribonucleoside-diphosphate reductase alpha chain